MSFLLSASKAHLVDGHILKAVLTNRDGNSCDAELDLDEFIDNQDGWFMWDGYKFSHSAHSISLEGSLLTAELAMADGGYRERQSVDLNERISNEDGVLVFI